MKKVLVLLLVLVTVLSLAACGEQTDGQTPVSMDMNTTYHSIAGAVEAPEMLELTEDLMLDYCGIRKEMVKQAKVMICADSLRTDEIWLLEAVDEAAAKNLVALANKRLEKKGEENITYSPEQYAVVQKAELVHSGLYIGLFVSPDAAAMANVFRADAGIK